MACRNWSRQLDPDSFNSAIFKGSKLGNWVLAGVHSRFSISELDLSNEAVVTTYRRYLANSALVKEALENLFIQFIPDHVLCYSGVLAFYRTAFEVSRSRGIPVLVHERGGLPDSFVMINNENAHMPYNIFKGWELWKDEALAPDELEWAKGYIEARENGRNLNFHSAYNFSSSAIEVRHHLRIPQSSRILAVFPSNDWEYAMLRSSCQVSFASQIEGLRAIVQAKLPAQWTIVIRLHPPLGYSHLDIGSQFIEQMLDFSRNLPEHVRLIMPWEKLTSYALLWNVDAVLTFGSTLGLEAPFKGVSVASHACNSYSIAVPYCHDPGGYEDLSESLFRQSEVFGIETLRNAYRGLYYLFKRLSFRFKSFGIKDIHFADIRLSDLSDLDHGQDTSLDHICEHIIEGAPLIVGPSRELHSSTDEEESGFLERELIDIRKRRREINDRGKALAEQPETLLTVFRIRQDVKSDTQDTILSKSIRRSRHKKLETFPHNDIYFMPGRNGRQFARAMEDAASKAKGDYFYIGVDNAMIDESFFSQAVDFLDQEDNEKWDGILSGLWVCDENGRLTKKELFVKDDWSTTFDDSVAVFPILKQPSTFLSLVLMRKDSWNRFWEALSDVHSCGAELSRSIFEMLVGNQDRFRLHSLAQPLITWYSNPSGEAKVSNKKTTGFPKENPSSTTMVETIENSYKHFDDDTYQRCLTLIRKGHLWPARFIVEGYLDHFPNEKRYGELLENLSSKIAGRLPNYNDVAIAVESVEGWLVPGQEQFLFEKVFSLPDDAAIMEIGSCYGRSTAAMAFSCWGTSKHIWAIDTFLGNINGGTATKGDSFFEIWKNNMIRWGLEKYITACPGFSREVLENWNGPKSLDFVFIDASHHYVDVLKELELVYPMVKDGGWIAFHDVEPGWPGPWRVWCETAQPLLADHVQVSTLACGRKVAGRELTLPAPGARFAYAAHWASTLRAALPELCRAMQASLEGAGDPDSREQAEGVIARMPTSACRTMMEMLKLEAAEDPHLHFWKALVQARAGEIEDAKISLETAAKGADGPLQHRLEVWRKRLCPSTVDTVAVNELSPMASDADIIDSVTPSQGAKPHVLFCTTYYAGFLREHLNRRPDLAQASYNVQRDALLHAFFGDADFYSHAIASCGWVGIDVIPNCEPLQQRWAEEQKAAGSWADILVAQVRHHKPDVFYLHDMSLGTRALIEAVRPFVGLIVGQIACPISPQTYLAGFDIIFSSFPHYVKRFRENGITSYYQPLAFDSRVMFRIGAPSRDLPVTFIGGLSGHHTKGGRLLEYLAERTPIQFWGYGAGQLPADSKVRRAHHGEAWGLDMFHLLARSRITVNRHIDVAENYANNMRLFEATGCGALLVTDYRDNLDELFTIGKEVVAYRSPEECAALIQYYLAHPQEAAAIAQAGRMRTLRDHGYDQRMAQTAEILERHLRYRQEKDRYLMPTSISANYRPIPADKVSERLTRAWQDDSIPERQRGLVQRELAAMYQGRPPQVYQVLADALRGCLGSADRLLEIGCASGYYYEALSYILNRPIRYTGVDYSHPLIVMAKDFYPQTQFHVADGAALPYADNAFDVVVSSCVLLHVTNFEAHIAETARVAGRWVVAHRTPVCRRRPTQYMTKTAYGVETVELRFNEGDLLAAFAVAGLECRDRVVFAADEGQDAFEVTYRFAKRPVPGVIPLTNGTAARAGSGWPKVVSAMA